jgi:hypothetical protein
MTAPALKFFVWGIWIPTEHSNVEVAAKSMDIDTVEMLQNVGKPMSERLVVMATGECLVDGCISVCHRTWMNCLTAAKKWQFISKCTMAGCSVTAIATFWLCSTKWIGIIFSLGALWAAYRYKGAQHVEKRAREDIVLSGERVADVREKVYKRVLPLPAADENCFCPGELKVIKGPHVSVDTRVSDWVFDKMNDISVTPEEKSLWVKKVFVDDPLPQATYLDTKDDITAIAPLKEKYNLFKALVSRPVGLLTYRARLPALKEAFLDELFELVVTDQDYQKQYIKKNAQMGERAGENFRKFMFTAMKADCPPCWEEYYEKLEHDLKYASTDYGIYFEKCWKLLRAAYNELSGPFPDIQVENILTMPELGPVSAETEIQVDNNFSKNATSYAGKYSGQEQAEYLQFLAELNS